MDISKYTASEYSSEIKADVQNLDAIRANKDKPRDVSLEEFVQTKYGVEFGAYLEDLGIDRSVDTIQNLFTMPDENARWLVPEFIREALRLGLRRAPIWPDVTAIQQSVSQPNVTMPHINMSDSAPRKVNEGETIPTGKITYGDKQARLTKIGRGIGITDEVRNYVVLNLISIFLEDMGVKLGQALDTEAIDVLINGEQASGAESAPTVGVATVGTLAYEDLLRVWIRMARLGRVPGVMIGGEEIARETLLLPEFKDRDEGVPEKQLNVRTPIPNSADYFIHGNVPDNQQIILDETSTLIKLDSQPLMVESERVVSNQSEYTYASLTTGFAILYRDARVVLDTSLDFASNGFPAYMDVDAEENEDIDFNRS